jgi:hypothetical protein
MLIRLKRAAGRPKDLEPEYWHAAAKTLTLASTPRHSMNRSTP